MTASGGINSADTTLLLATTRGPVPRHLAEHGRHLHGRLDADGHLERGEHGRRADQHGEREDLAVDGRRAHVPVRPGGEHAERRLRGGDAAERRRRRTRASRSRRSGTSSSTSRTPTSRSRSRASSGSTRSGSAGTTPSTATTRPPARTAARTRATRRASSRTARPPSARRRSAATVRSATSNVVLGGGGLITGDVRAGTTITAAAGAILGTKTPNSPSATLNPSPVAACSPYTAAVDRRHELQRRDRRPRDRLREDGARSRPARTASTTSRSRAPACSTPAARS